MGKKVGLREVSQTHTPSLRAFRSVVWKYWKENGRHDLPWRKTKDPYRILVSEVMLQQTQVSRVTEKYREFLKAFPTVRKLADAKLADVLRIWSGLGYNRRGKYLHDAAKVIVAMYKGNVPKGKALLKTLPGLGEYTAGAVRVFAFNEPDVLIETNIRAVYIHHFFPNTSNAHDREVLMAARKAGEGQGPREWHWALMDYGVHIKKLHQNPARKSAHYTKQSKFEGSLRQVRGVILKALSSKKDISQIQKLYKTQFDTALAGLESDGLVVRRRKKWVLA